MPTRDEILSHAAVQQTPRVLRRIAVTLERQQKVAEWDALQRNFFGENPTITGATPILVPEEVTARLTALENELWPERNDA